VKLGKIVKLQTNIKLEEKLVEVDLTRVYHFLIIHTSSTSWTRSTYCM